MNEYKNIDNFKCNFSFSTRRNRTIPSFSRTGSDETDIIQWSKNENNKKEINEKYWSVKKKSHN